MAVAADPIQTLKNKATNRCLDDSGKGLRTLACYPNSSPSRKFQSWS
ncbi:hypothetical protein ACIA58_36475 [Kribbella sp. NPDC051586]